MGSCCLLSMKEYQEGVQYLSQGTSTGTDSPRHFGLCVCVVPSLKVGIFQARQREYLFALIPGSAYVWVVPSRAKASNSKDMHASIQSLALGMWISRLLHINNYINRKQYVKLMTQSKYHIVIEINKVEQSKYK